MIDWNSIYQDAMVLMVGLIWIFTIRIVAMLAKFEEGKRKFLNSIVLFQAVAMIAAVFISGNLNPKHSTTLLEWIAIIVITGYYSLTIGGHIAALTNKFIFRPALVSMALVGVVLVTVMISHSGWLAMGMISITLFATVWYCVNDVGFGANFQTYLEVRNKLENKK